MEQHRLGQRLRSFIHESTPVVPLCEQNLDLWLSGPLASNRENAGDFAFCVERVVPDVIDGAELGYLLMQAKKFFFVPRNFPNMIALVLRAEVTSSAYGEQLACFSMEANGHASQRKHNAAP